MLLVTKKVRDIVEITFLVNTAAIYRRKDREDLTIGVEIASRLQVLIRYDAVCPPIRYDKMYL